ncbi:hypothetical protein BJ085DRAFT_33865 [Dimargaris cristalligena]|uniref:Uncharacterized protein n=1 Tax=Dimargaris cristalligena TaxID=215637 RepID=A0A4Q0A261_9FUNG|nr:hypothetical protein BJ085DRAFT_33865 [Dimargaris cristalligena]|eukprot:RKP40154.1 hypothetical protein BJ085DRAFT_33865 [Dimargaris cristalligena]
MKLTTTAFKLALAAVMISCVSNHHALGEPLPGLFGLGRDKPAVNAPFTLEGFASDISNLLDSYDQPKLVKKFWEKFALDWFTAAPLETWDTALDRIAGKGDPSYEKLVGSRRSNQPSDIPNNQGEVYSKFLKDNGSPQSSMGSHISIDMGQLSPEVLKSQFPLVASVNPEILVNLFETTIMAYFQSNDLAAMYMPDPSSGLNLKNGRAFLPLNEVLPELVKRVSIGSIWNIYYTSSSLANNDPLTDFWQSAIGLAIEQANNRAVAEKLFPLLRQYALFAVTVAATHQAGQVIQSICTLMNELEDSAQPEYGIAFKYLLKAHIARTNTLALPISGRFLDGIYDSLELIDGEKYAVDETLDVFNDAYYELKDTGDLIQKVRDINL